MHTRTLVSAVLVGLLVFGAIGANKASASSSDIVSDPTLTTGLVSYWPLDEESGERTDVVGANNLFDSSSVSSDVGVVDRAGHFVRNESDYLVMQDAEQNGLEPDNISITLWSKVTPGLANVSDVYLLSKRYFAEGYSVSLQDWGRLWWQVGDNYLCTVAACGGTVHTTYENIDDGVWHHVVATYDGSLAKLYVDGMLAAEKQWTTSSLDTGHPFYLGQLTGKYFHDGALDEVGIWNRALTAEEVARLYNNGRGLPYSNVEDPEPDPPFATSSVAFLPGIMGSRLYSFEGLGRNRLWESFLDRDIRALALNAEGESENGWIYTRDALDYAFKFAGKWLFDGEGYAGLLDYLDTLEDEQVIAEWNVLPYDWRLAFEALREGGVDIEVEGDPLRHINYNIPTDAPYLYEELERLADAAPSGKVTIVAHSNGGLLAKHLLRSLEESNDPLLQKIDKLILVGSPQLGTPKALGDLLHGTLDALHIERSVRAVSENMPGAYQLLPSPELFDTLERPVAVFGSSVASLPGCAGLAGVSVDSYDKMHALAQGWNGTWEKPAKNDLATPNVLNDTLFDAAREEHEDLDSWDPPSTLKVSQIVGVGRATPSTLLYYSSCTKHWCLGPIRRSLGHEYVLSLNGDGTVLTPSAAAGAWPTYYFALHEYNAARLNDRAHTDLLSAGPVQGLVRKLLLGAQLEEDDLPTYLSVQSPDLDDVWQFQARLYSPLDIELTDAYGHRTGALPGNEDGAFGRRIEEDVPNSYYFEQGEVKYLGVFAGAPRTFSLRGRGEGLARLELEVLTGDTSVRTLVYDALPVTSAASGTLTVRSTSHTPTLALDVDGNGTVDMNVAPTVGDKLVSTGDLLKRLRAFTRVSEMPSWLSRWIDGRLEIAEKLIVKGGKGNLTAAKVLLKTVLFTIDNHTGKLIPASEAEVLRALLQEVLGRL